jgi:hypothetical protein
VGFNGDERLELLANAPPEQYERHDTEKDGVGEYIERENYRLCLEAGASKQGARRAENGCKSAAVRVKMPDVFESCEMQNSTAQNSSEHRHRGP